MSDYSWIKPGAKAVIIGAKNHPELLGVVVTVIDYPKKMTNSFRGSTWSGVEIEEGFYLARKVGSLFGRIAPDRSSLMPLKGDDEQFRKEAEKEKPKCQSVG